MAHLQCVAQSPVTRAGTPDSKAIRFGHFSSAGVYSFTHTAGVYSFTHTYHIQGFGSDASRFAWPAQLHACCVCVCVCVCTAPSCWKPLAALLRCFLLISAVRPTVGRVFVVCCALRPGRALNCCETSDCGGGDVWLRQSGFWCDVVSLWVWWGLGARQRGHSHNGRQPNLGKPDAKITKSAIIHSKGPCTKPGRRPTLTEPKTRQNPPKQLQAMAPVQVCSTRQNGAHVGAGTCRQS